jgi:hypothetical protein
VLVVPYRGLDTSRTAAIPNNVESAVVDRGGNIPMRALLTMYFSLTRFVPPWRRGMAFLLRT